MKNRNFNLNKIKQAIIVSALEAYLTDKPSKYLGNTLENQKINLSSAQKALDSILDKHSQIHIEQCRIINIALLYYSDLLKIRNLISRDDIYLINTSDPVQFSEFEETLVHFERLVDDFQNSLL